MKSIVSITLILSIFASGCQNNPEKSIEKTEVKKEEVKQNFIEDRELKVQIDPDYVAPLTPPQPFETLPENVTLLQDLPENAVVEDKPDPDFSKLNPDFRDRAGAFYDITYVTPSGKDLFKIADIRPGQMQKTLKNLRLFVEDYMDKYVPGGGFISKEETDVCRKKLNERFRRLLDDEQYKKYLKWSNDQTGSINKMSFIMWK